MNPMSDVNPQLFPGKKFVSNILEALETKDQMSSQFVQRYLMRAAVAGMVVAVMYVVNYAVIAHFVDMDFGATHLGGMGKLIGAFCFGWALVFIYFTKSELLTSNMMIVSIGYYHHKVSIWRGLKLMTLCWVGNFLGGLLFAILYLGSSLVDGATGEQMIHSVEVKLGYLESFSGCSDLLVRAILCNFMINLAMLLIYNGFIKEDYAKCMAMVMAVFIFAFLGFEHSVANTVLFTIVGLNHGINVAAAAGNVAIALIGNMIGGGLLIGAYYAYVNDDKNSKRPEPISQV